MNSRAIPSSRPFVLMIAVASLGLPAPCVRSQVTGLQARHYEGQTLLTWAETPAIAATIPGSMTMNEVRSFRTAHANTSYRVYRAAAPITSVSGLTPIRAVGVLSGWNTGFHGHDNAASEDGASFRYVVERETGFTPAAPLAREVAVCAHNPPAAGTSHYAVTVVTDGVENPALNSGNTVTVVETVGAGIPILQRVENRFDWMYTSANTTHYFYTRWESPPRSNVHGRPIDYMVAVPPSYHPASPMPSIVSFHGWAGNLAVMSWWFNFEAGTIVVTSNEEPYDWWTGYHELSDLAPRTEADWHDGVVRPYTQNRINAFHDFVATKWNIDRSRTVLTGVSMGGSGSIMYSLRQPDRVAWCNSWVGVHIPAESPTFRSSYAMNYGEPDWNVLFEDGITPAFTYFDDNWYLRNHITTNTPFITFSNGKNDDGIGWGQAAKFFRALQDTKRPHIFYWGQAGHGQRTLCPPDIDGNFYEDRNPIDIRIDQSLPAFTHCSLDDNPGNGDPANGDPEGQSNGFLFWQTTDTVDLPREWAMTIGLVQTAPANTCTVSLTPRRLQQLVTAPGASFRWTNTALASGIVVQSGTVTADSDGLVTIDNLQVAQITRDGGGSRIRILAQGETFEIGLTPAREIHVATTGNDSSGNGSATLPFRTIGHAASLATPGTAIRVHAGTYTGDIWISGLSGTAAAPIWIGGAPGEANPVISGGGEGLHLSRVRYLVLHNLEVTGAGDNGINCDDGSDYANTEATRHVVFRNLRIHHVGTSGNQDELKLSGVNDYFVLDSEIADGSSGGSGIDHVGCHGGLITRNRFLRAGTNAIQCKGGSANIEIRANRFEDCGDRTLNIGGSTGFTFFRPPLSTTATNVEASDIRVVANVIRGSDAPLAFVGATNCLALHNTIIDPHHWIARILQETVTTAPYTFAPCGSNIVANNIVYYDRTALSTFINVGPNTSPVTFSFDHNLWYNYNNPAQSTPSLPVAESGGIYGIDPLFVSVALDDLRLRPGSPALVAGAIHSQAGTDFAGNLFGSPPALGAFEQPGADYPAWRAMNFTAADFANDSISAPLADPDLAGVTNLQRYAHGLPARGLGAAPAILGTTTVGPNNYLTLTFDRRISGSDLSYIIEACDDLATWSVVSTFPPGTPTHVTFRDPVAMPAADIPRRFLRLRVEIQP
ncbi:MAG: alpha/beta hydrolase-fold protein [Verrucomicrobia bacterium]|nr:alpha/beta hydrolase-fold protein [Verrucomicrobiota bacterium]